MLEFDYGGYHRVVQLCCRGFTRKGARDPARGQATRLASESCETSWGRDFDSGDPPFRIADRDRTLGDRIAALPMDAL